MLISNSLLNRRQGLQPLRGVIVLRFFISAILFNRIYVDAVCDANVANRITAAGYINKKTFKKLFAINYGVLN